MTDQANVAAEAPSTEGYAQGWLEYEQALGTRPILQGSAYDIVEQFNGLGAVLATQIPPPDDSVSTKNESADGVPVRIYTPAGVEGPLPVGIYFHGGGLLCGNLDSEDPWCRYIAKNTPCVLVSVDYRLSLEAPFPAQFDDGVKAYNWAVEKIKSLNGKSSQFFTIGASAGGGLALGVADHLVSTGSKSLIAGVVAMVPVTTHPDSPPEGYEQHYTAYQENGSGVPIIDKSSMTTFFEASQVEPGDNRAFVTKSKHLKDMPPTYIATCGKDPLRDDGVVLEMILKDKGVKVHRDHYDGEPHYFWMFPGIKGGDEFLANVVKGLKFILS